MKTIFRKYARSTSDIEDYFKQNQCYRFFRVNGVYYVEGNFGEMLTMEHEEFMKSFELM